MHTLPEFLHVCPNPVRFAGEYAACADFPLHQHTCWEVVYQRAGAIQCRQGGEVLAVHPGTVLVHPPHVPHADLAASPYALYHVSVDAPPGMPWPRVCHDDAAQSLGALCAAIVREWWGQGAGRDRMLGLLAGELDVRLRRAHEGRAPGDGAHAERLVAEAERVLDERYREAPSSQALARAVGVSRSSLYEHFLRLRGRTPQEYLQSVRLRRALALLHHSTMTLEAVAAQCGYHSASHLSRHVKAATGDSPGRLRRAGAPVTAPGPAGPAGPPAAGAGGPSSGPPAPGSG